MSTIYLGTENYPLIDFDEAGNLGARSSDLYPIQLQTTIKAPEGVDLNDYIYGIYIRNIPSRGLLSSTNSEMDRRNLLNDDELRIYASGFLGAPGTGKTFFFSTLGRMMHEKGAILVDCSDKDLKTLFENPTFDTQSANREKAAIDAKIKMYNMGHKEYISAESLTALKELVGNAWHEEDGRITIDWSAISFEGEDMAAYEYQANVFQTALREICKKEGIDIASSAMNVGIKMADGELFRVFDPQSPDYGRPIILDELNRAKPGTMDNLYGILNFLNSTNMRTYKIKGANGRELVIDKNKIPKTFYLNFTGNQAVEGMGSDAFNDPFLSRIPEGFALKTIPDTKPGDLADMISSYLMGVPGTLLKEAFNINMNDPEDAKDFIAFLKEARTIGLTPQQISEIPSWQMHNIDNAEKIITLSAQMGMFFYDIKQLLGLRGEAYEGIDGLTLEQPYEEYLKQKGIDYRIIPHFFIQADQIKGNVSKTKRPKLGTKNKSVKKPAESIDASTRYATRGFRLQAVMADWLKKTFIPDDMGVRKITEDEAQKMYQAALQLAYENLILPQNNIEAKKAAEPIAELYNINVYDGDGYYKQLQSIFVKHLHQLYPDVDGTDDEILPVSVVQSTITTLAEEDRSSPLLVAYKAHNLLVVNEDPDEIGTQVFKQASFVSDITVPEVSSEALLLSLGTSELGETNLKTLFQMPQLSNLSSARKEKLETYLDFNAEGDIKFTLIKTANATTQKDDYLFAFYHKKTKSMLIIGDSISPEVQDKFTKPNQWTYLDRTRTNSETIMSKLDEVLDGESFLMECFVSDAYGLSSVEDLEAMISLSSAELEKLQQNTRKNGKEPSCVQIIRSTENKKKQTPAPWMANKRGR